MSRKNIFLNSNNQIPLWELEFHLWNKFEFGKLIIGEEFSKLSTESKSTAIKKNAEIISQVSSKLNFSAVTIPGSFWEVAPGEPAYFWLPEDAALELCELLKNESDNNFEVIVNATGVMAVPSSAEYMEFSCMLFENPDDISNRAIQILESSKNKISRFIDVGVTTFFTASDIADNSGPYFNAEQMDMFIYPYLEEWTAYIKERNGTAILHSDGNINLYMERLIDCGIDAVQAIDPIAGMNMPEVLRKIDSRISACGNVDCGLLLMESPEIVYEKTYELLSECFDIGRFVLGASNAVQQEVPLENYLALNQARLDFNKNIEEK